MAPSTRPRRTPKARPAPAVIRADEGDSNLDPMDIVLGVVWAIVIPAGMYMLLYFAGMPPGGGGQGADWEAQLRQRDELAAVQPPVTLREIDARIARVDALIQDRIPDYLTRAKATDDNRLKNWWQELAFRVLGVCKNELEQVGSDIPNSPELRGRPEVEQGIRRRIAHIESQEEEIIRNSPFPDRLRAAQLEAVQNAAGP